VQESRQLFKKDYMHIIFTHSGIQPAFTSAEPLSSARGYPIMHAIWDQLTLSSGKPSIALSGAFKLPGFNISCYKSICDFVMQAVQHHQDNRSIG